MGGSFSYLSIQFGVDKVAVGDSGGRTDNGPGNRRGVDVVDIGQMLRSFLLLQVSQRSL